MYCRQEMGVKWEAGRLVKSAKHSGRDNQCDMHPGIVTDIVTEDCYMINGGRYFSVDCLTN